MSVRVLTKVFDGFPGRGSELLAMLALADWSDDDGRCFPAVAAIARKVRLKERQTQRVVNQLINDGFVIVEANKGGGMPGESRRYRIVLHRLTGVLDDTPTGDTHDTPTGVPDDADGCHFAPLTGVLDDTLTVMEPSLTVSTSSQSDVFDIFWRAYPNKKAKGDAQRAWKRLKPNAGLAASILQAIEAQKSSEDWTKENGKFIPHPATWLNGRRWEDENVSTGLETGSSLRNLPGML